MLFCRRKEYPSFLCIFLVRVQIVADLYQLILLEEKKSNHLKK